MRKQYRKNEFNKERQEQLIPRLRAILLRDPMPYYKLAPMIGISKFSLMGFINQSCASSLIILGKIEQWIMKQEINLKNS